MPLVWGRYYTDEELQQIAEEMNRIGKNIEKKTEGVRHWIRDVEERKKANPDGKVF